VRRALAIGAVGLAATIGLAAALALSPGNWRLALDVYVVFLGAVLLAGIVRATGRSGAALEPSKLELALLERPAREERIAELARLERELSMSRQTAFDAHYRLRPILREIARHRLARHGVDLDAPGGSAERLLGPDAWALVRPDLPRPMDHLAPGVPLEIVERAIESLEAVR
jgi:hypothetical protein